jgi:hypothetical protein
MRIRFTTTFDDGSALTHIAARRPTIHYLDAPLWGELAADPTMHCASRSGTLAERIYDPRDLADLTQERDDLKAENAHIMGCNDRQAYTIAGFAAEITKLKAENAQIAADNLITVCAHCGATIARDRPPESAAAVAAHVAHCPMNPLVQANAHLNNSVGTLFAQVAVLKAESQITVCLHCGEAIAWDRGPEAQDAIREHTRTCPKNPLVQERDARQADVECQKRHVHRTRSCNARLAGERDVLKVQLARLQAANAQLNRAVTLPAGDTWCCACGVTNRSPAAAVKHDRTCPENPLVQRVARAEAEILSLSSSATPLRPSVSNVGPRLDKIEHDIDVRGHRHKHLAARVDDIEADIAATSATVSSDLTRHGATIEKVRGHIDAVNALLHAHLDSHKPISATPGA